MHHRISKNIITLQQQTGCHTKMSSSVQTLVMYGENKNIACQGANIVWPLQQ